MPPLTDAHVRTVTATVPLAGPDVAVIVAAPSATAVTSPADDTVAATVFDDDQLTTAPDITVPPASATVAVSVAVSPIDARTSESSKSSTADAT